MVEKPADGLRTGDAGCSVFRTNYAKSDAEPMQIAAQHLTTPISKAKS